MTGLVRRFNSSCPCIKRLRRDRAPKSSHEPASAREQIVFVIDDDASMRRALTNLFQSVGFPAPGLLIKIEFVLRSDGALGRLILD